jgi:hypothetical protein
VYAHWVTDNNLTKVSVNFRQEAVDALNEATGREGLSRTDVLNRAVLLYNFFSDRREAGDGVYLKSPGSAKVREVLFL